MTALLFSAASFLAVCLVAWQGFRNGDRPDDADVTVGLIATAVPGRPTLALLVTVQNRSDAPAMVVVGVGSATPLRARLVADRRGTAIRRRSDLRGRTLLGAVDGNRTRTWLLPLPDPVVVGVRGDVSVEQGGGRTRIFSVVRTVDRTGPIGAVRSRLSGRTVRRTAGPGPVSRSGG